MPHKKHKFNVIQNLLVNLIENVYGNFNEVELLFTLSSLFVSNGLMVGGKIF